MRNVTSAEVVSFWREAGPERWFGKDEGFDLTIRTRFLAIHEAATRGEQLALWEESPEGALALATLLDQFPLSISDNCVFLVPFQGHAGSQELP